MKNSYKPVALWKKGVVVAAVAGALSVTGAGMAFANTVPGVDGPSAYNTGDLTSQENTYLTTSAVRAGSAGPDFLGITNANYDFTASHSKLSDSSYVNADYYPFIASTVDGDKGYAKDMTGTDVYNRIAIWASAAVNENPNPYYQNLVYNWIVSEGTTQATTTATLATTYHQNPGTSSWGDSRGTAITRADGSSTIIGMEYYPDIIYGANKTSNWGGDFSQNVGGATNFKTQADKEEGYDPTFANNDSTNVWAQIYSMEQLAYTANSLTSGTAKTTRYDDSDATVSALAYEKAIKGQMLYIASKIDDKTVEKKTVAYLYAIDENGTAYFFVPTAEGLTNGDDTGKTATSTAATADDNYAANNSTINMGYMATLPFISNTFGAGDEAVTEVEGGIVMMVEDIYKSNPAVSLAEATEDGDSIMADVDVIIYNSTKNTNLQGTSGGKNSSGVNNGARLTDTNVTEWAAKHGFKGKVVAGDDFGTSNQQDGSMESAPILYCQRNYTADKDTRAAWAFSKVYSELYDSEYDTYGYWVDNVYHVNTDMVSTVVKAFTHATGDVAYSGSDAIEAKADAGYDWWTTTGSTSEDWADFAYYNGSSRASYYRTDAYAATSEEPTNTIGIFAPSALWNASEGVETVSAPVSQTVYAGATATFSVEAYGGTAASYQWYYSKADGTWAKVSTATAKTAALEVAASAAKDGRQYKCAVTFEDGQVVESAAAELSVVANEITQQPAAASVAVGTTAKFTVAATNAAGYQWQYYTGSKWANVTTATAKTATLEVAATAAKDDRQYRCVVTFENGKTATSTAATLEVIANEITAQPESATAAIGDTATFSVAANNDATYQWQYSKNGTSWSKVTTATATTANLSVAATAAKDGRQYRCVVTFANGKTLTSDAATLTVEK